MSPNTSIAELLAAAQQRQSWPEAKLAVDTRPMDATAAASPLQAALRVLGERIELALGARSVVVDQQLTQLRQLLEAPQPPEEASPVWAALDELEDQLETLLRD